jgi:hypothetical protein
VPSAACRVARLGHSVLAGLTACSSFCGQSCACPIFETLPRGHALGVLLRLAPQPPVVTLQTTSQCPCRAHRNPHGEACAGTTLRPHGRKKAMTRRERRASATHQPKQRRAPGGRPSPAAAYRDPRMCIGPATVVIIPEFKQPLPRTARQKIPTIRRVLFLPDNAQFSDSRAHPSTYTLQGPSERRAGPWAGQQVMPPILANQSVRPASTAADGRSERWPGRPCRNGWRPGLRIITRRMPSRCRPMSSAS